MGASLLAKTVGQAIVMLNVLPPSRAGSLPQVRRTHDRSHALRGNVAGDALRPTRSQPSAAPTEDVQDVTNAPEPRALAVSYL